MIPVVSSWQAIAGLSCQNLISHFQIPSHGHLNIILQLMQIVHSVNDSWDYFAFCEHDCLYPDLYFQEISGLLSGSEFRGIASENHIGLRPGGFAKCWYHTQPLFAMVVRRDVMLKALDIKLRECVLNGWCCIEPDDRSNWLIRKPDEKIVPIVHVNMETTVANHHLTSHHQFYSMTATTEEHVHWGHHSRFDVFTEAEADQVSKPVIDQTKSRIVDARYGDFPGNKTISYMEVLQSRGFSGLFHVCNADAGSDPAPGIVKSLRLQIVTGNSQCSQLEFNENTVFRL